MIAGLVGHYRVVTTLGTGGMGVVYKAIDTHLNRPVAIKALRESGDLATDAIVKLRREALAAASLDHPYICKIYELLETQTGTLIVMEFVEGETLAAVLRRGIPRLVDTLRYGSEIAEGLASAHCHGLVHRDVKPSNVMVTPSGHVKLLDFGIARTGVPGGTTTVTAGTDSRTVAGTPLYMAPEQALALPVTGRADLFSLGVVLFECLTGQLPFESATPDAYVQAMLMGYTRPLDELAPSAPESVRRLVQACLQIEPTRRPESASEVATTLRRAADVLSTSATVTDDGAALVPRGLLQSIVLVITLCALAGAYLLWRASGPVPPAVSLRPEVTWGSAESDPRFSPNGLWLSFLSDRDGPVKVFVKEVGGDSEPKALDVPGAGVILSHVWAPDNREIACVVRQDGGSFLELVPAPWGGVPRVTIPLKPRPEDARVTRWIADAIYLSVNLGPAGHALWRIIPASGKSEDVTETWSLNLKGNSFDVSPDGRYAVFAARDGQEDLWTARLDGSNLTRLTDDESVERNPIWLGNARIVFQSNKSGHLNLWTMTVRSRQSEAVTSGPTVETPGDTIIDPSTRGGLIAYEQLTESSNVWILDPLGGRPRQLTGDALSDYAPSVRIDTIALQRTGPRLEEGFPFLDSRILVARLVARARISDSVFLAAGFAPRLSADATWVAYLQRSRESTGDLLQARNLQSNETRTIWPAVPLPAMSIGFPAEYAAQKVTWSSTGAVLYFAGAVRGNDRRDQILHLNMSRLGNPEVLFMGSPGDVIDDLRLSPDGARLAYLVWTPKGFQIHVRNLRSGKDEVVRDEPGPRTHVFLRGWMEKGRSILYLRTYLNPDWTDRIDITEVTELRTTRIVATIDNALATTARLDPTGGWLYVTRVERGVHNLHAVSLADGRVRRVTDNEKQGVSFAGIEPLADGTTVYTRPEWKRDIWLARIGGR